MEHYVIDETTGNWLLTDDETAPEYDEYEHFQNLKERIDAWDHENIRDLLDILGQIPQSMSDRIDYSDLPTEAIPAGLEAYPIWAMDKHGRCLVGETADKIEEIEEIRDWYAERGN